MPHDHPESGPARTTGRSAGCNRSASPPMPCCRVVSPKSTSPNPASAAPAPDTRPRPRSLVRAPTKIIGSAAAVSETRTPISATNQAVPVVPTFAPKTRPNPCGNVNNPALTRPIVVIVVALDDCTKSVTMAPQKEPRSGVAAALLSTVRSAEPANAFRPAVITVMPSRKRPMPPSTEIAVDTPAPEINDDQVICYSAAAARRQLKWWQCWILARALLLLSTKLRTRSSQFLLFCRVDRWVGEIEFLHRLHDGCSDDEPSKPFVVSRHHVPRG